MWMSGLGRLRQMDDCWLLGWTGQQVDHVVVDGAAVLTLSGGVTLTVEDEGFAAQAPALLRTYVTGSVGCTSGELRLAFSDGSRFSVGPHGERRSWTSSGPGQPRCGSPAGGGLEIAV